MRAILFATGNTAMSGLTETVPAPLLPLLDRPFLQHVLEHLVDHGFLQFDFVLSEHPDQIEAHFGDGKRWGCQIRYYLARDSASPYGVLRVAAPGDGLTLIAHADRLPLLPEGSFTAHAPALFDDTRKQWTGWARIPGELLPGIAAAASEAEVEKTLRAAILGRVETAVVLDILSYEGFLNANRQLLDGLFPTPLLTGRQAEERVWISRNVSIHPTARLTAPIFIGENCRIGQAADVGPMAVLGRNSVLDKQSTVRESIVLPGSYVGEALDVENSIIDRGRLINVSLGVELTIGEEFLLGSIAGGGASRGIQLGRRAFAVLALLALSPVFLAAALGLAIFRRGPVFYKTQIVRTPAGSDPDRWRTVPVLAMSKGAVRSSAAHFLLCFLPGLISVIAGRIGLVGVEPRSRPQIEALPADWRALCLRTKAGLVTEAFVQYGAESDPDEQFACEAFYAVSARPRLDAAILFRYLGRVCGLAGDRSRSRATTAGGPS